MLRVDLVRDPLRPPDQPIQVSISPEDPKLRLPADGFRLTRLEPSNQAMLGPFPPGWYLVLACYHDDYPSGGLTKLGWMRLKARAVRVELREGATETIQAKPTVLKSSR
jgi:hypothetical protein